MVPHTTYNKSNVHRPGRFRECVRPVQDVNHCQHRPGRFRECARPMQEMNHCRHGPARFRKCAKPNLETCVAGIGRPVAGNGLRPVLVMVQATHFRKWHVPFPAIYHFQNGADHKRTVPVVAKKKGGVSLRTVDTPKTRFPASMFQLDRGRLRVTNTFHSSVM